MSENNNSLLVNTLFKVVGLLVLIILILLGWKITGFQIFGFEVEPPTTDSGVFPASANTPSSSRPSGVSLSAGETFIPSEGWVWVCTGNFSMIQANGNNLNLHDQLETTGDIVVLDPDSKVTLIAPYGGSCQPYLQNERDSAISATVSQMLSSPSQCIGGCSSCTIYELDNIGNITNTYSEK